MIGNREMHRSRHGRRAIASLLVAALAAVAAPRAEARAYHVNLKGVGGSGARALGEDVAIGLGITTGVLMLVGGVIWYAVHRHHEEAQPPPADMAPAPVE